MMNVLTNVHKSIFLFCNVYVIHLCIYLYICITVCKPSLFFMYIWIFLHVYKYNIYLNVCILYVCIHSCLYLCVYNVYFYFVMYMYLCKQECMKLYTKIISLLCYVHECIVVCVVCMYDLCMHVHIGLLLLCIVYVCN